jgi:hypothetical protein
MQSDTWARTLGSSIAASIVYKRSSSRFCERELERPLVRTSDHGLFLKMAEA